MTQLDVAEVESAQDANSLECLYFYLTAAEDQSAAPDKQADEGYALPMHAVREIIRVPELNAVPLAGAHVMGVTNLRGSVLPVVSLRELVGLRHGQLTKHSRIVVLRGRNPLGLWVDWVEKVAWVPEARLDTSELVRHKAQHRLLAGFVRPDPEAEAGETRLRRLLNATAIEAASLSPGIDAGESISRGHGQAGTEEQIKAEQQYTCFELGSQLYALAISQIKEVVRVPAQLEPVSGMPAHVMGVLALRDLMIPLVHLTRLYGLPHSDLSSEARVVVVPVGARDGQLFVGLVVDRIRHVVNRSEDQVQPVPETLGSLPGFQDMHGMLRYDDNADSLAALIDTRRLLKQGAFQDALAAVEDNEVTANAADDHRDERQIVVFRLGDEEYGVAIEATKEILRVPDTLTRVPQAAHFIEGVINLRGMVLPIIDLRKRFDMTPSERHHQQRIVVLNLQGQRTGFIVDAVREVASVPLDSVEAAPPLSPQQSSLITEMVNLAASDRLILLLDTGRLVSEQEARKLAQVSAERSQSETTDD